MSHHPIHRIVDGAEAVLYGVGTIVGGTLTVGFGTATLACIPVIWTGVAIIPMVIFGAATYGSVGLTTYTGSKTIHKTSHVLGGQRKCHSGTHALKALSFFQYKK